MSYCQNDLIGIGNLTFDNRFDTRIFLFPIYESYGDFTIFSTSVILLRFSIEIVQKDMSRSLWLRRPYIVRSYGFTKRVRFDLVSILSFLYNYQNYVTTV